MSDKVDNEELSSFIESTLKAVADGVGRVSEVKQGDDATRPYFGLPSKVSFDVAISASSSGEAGADLKLKVFNVGLETGGKKQVSSETVSRVSFDVPRTATTTTTSVKGSY